jgi:hypothetical protein
VEDFCPRSVEPEKLSYLLGQAHLSQEPARGLAVNLNVLLAGSLPGRQTSLLKRFLSEHAEDLRRDCAAIVIERGRRHLMTRNLFLPLSLGGLGVLPPVDWKYAVKESQLRVANWISDLGGALKSAGLPLPGFPLEKVELDMAVPWVKKAQSPSFPSFQKTVPMSSRTLRSLSSGVVHYCLHRSGVSI